MRSLLARHVIPVINVILVLVFLGENAFFAHRARIITESASALLVEHVESASGLIVRLDGLHPRKTPSRESTQNEGRQEFSLKFPPTYAMHLWVEYEPASDRISNYGLV